jgi:hypothetical protein
MHEDNRTVRSTTHTAPARSTTSAGPSREAEAISDLMVAPAGWRLSWGAVFAGVMVALAAQLVLNLLGVGTGLAGASSGTQLSWLGTGFGIWWTIAGILAAAIGGWIAGRTLGSGDRSDGMIHGLLSWAGATLVVAFVLTTAMGGMLGAGMQQQAMGQFGGITGQAGGGPAPGQQEGGAPGGPPTAKQLEQAAGAASGAAILSFIGLLLGAAAAAAGGRAGVSAARRALREEG